MQTPEVLGDRVIYASGYPVPVENGFVDLGIVEQAVDWLDRRVKELENFAKEAKLEVPAAKHGPPPRRDYQNYRQPSYQQRGRGGNSNGRGAYNRGAMAAATQASLAADTEEGIKTREAIQETQNSPFFP